VKWGCSGGCGEVLVETELSLYRVLGVKMTRTERVGDAPQKDFTWVSPFIRRSRRSARTPMTAREHHRPSPSVIDERRDPSRDKITCSSPHGPLSRAYGP